MPIPMFASHCVFSRRFFEVWVAFSIIWVLLAGGFCIILPIFESRKGIFILARSALRVMAGRRVKGDVVA